MVFLTLFVKRSITFRALVAHFQCIRTLLETTYEQGPFRYQEVLYHINQLLRTQILFATKGLRSPIFVLLRIRLIRDCFLRGPEIVRRCCDVIGWHSHVVHCRNLYKAERNADSAFPDQSLNRDKFKAL